MNTEKLLPGNEHFKRYLEIAATGDLNILCVTPNEMEHTVRDYAEQVLPDMKQLTIIAPCPCGYYGDMVKECRCTPAAILKWQRPFKKNLDQYHIITEVGRPEACKVVYNTSEPVERIKARAAEGRKHLPISFDTAKHDEYSLSLLEQAIKTYYLFPVQVENIKKIACVSAALAGRDKVKTEDVAEGVQAIMHRVIQ